MNDNPNTKIVSFDSEGDHAIAFAAKRGDDRAFGVLFRRYQAKIFAVAQRYTRVTEDAEDVVQQTFQKAFIHLHQFEGKSCFATWLTSIAVNEARMLLRRGRALREVPIDKSSGDETLTHGLEIPDSGPDPETNYLKREGTQTLAVAINKLTPRLRVAIELRELAELSTQEAAAQMGVSVAAVKARVFHGRKKLRKALRRLGITPPGTQVSALMRLANRSCASAR